MEILNNFGFEPILFLAQVINFLILAFIFKKFLYKPILKTLKNRKDVIAKGIENAEKAALELAHAEAKKDEIIKSASREADEILKSTKIGAEELRSKILDETKSESEKIIASARNQANMLMEDVEKRAKKASLNNSMAILEKALEQMFTKDEREKVFSRTVKILKEVD